AHASAIDIAITQSPDHLCIRVHDDGDGFEPEPPAALGRRQARWRGIGFATMRERAMLLRATLTVTSAPNDGTTVELMVPLAPEQLYEGALAGRTRMRFVRSPLAPERPASLPSALDLEVFRQMADMASEAFALGDRDGRFVYVNERACTMTGYAREDLLGRSVSHVNPDYPQPI